MPYLLDTGILLRLVNTNDNRHSVVRAAVGTLGDQGAELHIATQNVAEFCNVVTRPVENNGLGRAPAEALKALEADIEPICSVLAETETVLRELKRLIGTYNVVGKQVHDARLIAMMVAWRIESILTLNDRDFRRYEPEGISAVTPESVVASGAE